MPAEAAQDGFAPGLLLGDRFRIVRVVGQGGMGLVYEAVDEKLDRRVALKCAKPGFRHHLPPEARAAREVSHFNVCKVHDLHTLSTPIGDLDCLSMEFIEGEPLSNRIFRDGPLPKNEAREIARQICAGLAQAHRQGVVHGDLKTGNVMLGRSPEGGVRAVITDFGLAKMKDAPGRHGGTYDYMAPEQLLGEPPTVASDLYALGVLFHVMLTGGVPKRSGPLPADLPGGPRSPESYQSTITLGHAVSEADWRRKIDDLPSPWKRIVLACLTAQPAKRPRSAEAVAAALGPRTRALKWTAALAAAAALVAAGREWRTQAPVTPVRLAVLPFSLAGDRLESAAGIGGEVADRLSGARSKFTVISPREAERNQADTPDKARRMLGATHALQTQVRASAGQVATHALLVDLQSGRTIRELSGTYSAGDAPALAKALVATVTEAFRLPAITPKESVAPAAYRPYVEAVDLLRQDSANADKAIPLFTRAIALDPASALPYAGLAEAQVQKYIRGDGGQWLDDAETSVAKARSINPDSVPVLLASGSVQQEHGRYDQAIREFTRAADLAPGDSEA
ncbi:MAG TPA: protein kinase, partial [Bryobacteraceae bacterium]